MGSSLYPANYDELTVAAANELDSVTGEVDLSYTGATGEGFHALLHNDLAAAVNALQHMLGKNPQGGYASLVNRLAFTVGEIFTPEQFGAKGDLKFVSDAAITVSTKILTSATAAFTSADIGKTISIRGPGINENKNVMTTTIASVTNSTTVVLAAEAAVSVSGKVATYGTDDTAAIKEAVTKAYEEGISKGIFTGRIYFGGKYMVAGTTTKGGSTKGNAQIPMPYIEPKLTKFRMTLMFPGTGAPLIHWHQVAPQITAGTLFSPLVAAAADGTWSVPSVIGGPTVLAEDESTAGFSNMLFEIQGACTILVPRKANHMGIDAGLFANAKIDALSVLANAAATELVSDAAAGEFAGNGEGIRMPKFGNNVLSRCEELCLEGMSYGVGMGDHCQLDRLSTIYCKVGAFVGPLGSSAQHGGLIGYWSCEAGKNCMEVAANAGGKYPIDILRLDVEDGAGAGQDFIDAENALRGPCQFACNSSRAPKKTGAEHLKVTDNNNTA